MAGSAGAAQHYQFTGSSRYCQWVGLRPWLPVQPVRPLRRSMVGPADQVAGLAGQPLVAGLRSGLARPVVAGSPVSRRSRPVARSTRRGQVRRLCPLPGRSRAGATRAAGAAGLPVLREHCQCRRQSLSDQCSLRGRYRRQIPAVPCLRQSPEGRADQ